MEHSFSLDLLNLAILWCVGLVAVSVAINARGVVRVSLSWVVAIVVLGISLFVTTLKMSALQDELMHPKEVVEVAPPVPEPVVEPEPEGPSPSELEALANKEAWITEAKNIIRQGQTCAYSISTFDVGQIQHLSDTQYENLESKARSLRNQASNLSRLSKKLNPTPDLSRLNDDIVKASEALRSAGYAVHAFFGAEDGTQEATFHDQYLRQSRIAISNFKDLQSKVESTKP